MLDSIEIKISKEFIEKGYIIKKISNLDSLNYIYSTFKKNIYKELNIKPTNNYDIFNNLHNHIKIKDLNNFRMKLFNNTNKDNRFKKEFYNVCKDYINVIVGNELVMQKRINLSIQLPKDSSSLLPIHSDTWSGVSPYEVVVWLPLVNCYKTKSMFILPPEHSKKLEKKFKIFKNKSSDDIFKSINKKLKWIKINYGEILIFNQNLPHGNRINIEKETRWSLNCRFKSIFTPYFDKKIGDFYEPITLRAATKLGMNYKFPNIK